MKLRLITPLVIVLLAGSVAVPGSEPSAFNRVECGPLKGGEPARTITLSITGAKTLVLEAQGGGYAVWGEPFLILRDGTKMALSKCKPASSRVGAFQVYVDRGADQKPLQIPGRTLTSGLFAFANSRLVFEVPSDAVGFESLVGINHDGSVQQHAIFSVNTLPFGPDDYQRFEIARQELTETILANFEKSLKALCRVKTEKAADYRQDEEKIASVRARLGAIRAGLEAYDFTVLAEAEAFIEVKRHALCSLLDKPLLFARHPLYHSTHIYDTYLTWHPGGGIYVLENPSDPLPKQRVRAVIDPTTPETLGEGVYRDPDLSWDGKRVLFAFKGKEDGDTSLYEIGIDGKGLRRITNPGADCACKKAPSGIVGMGQHDVNPCYLPDGRIIFTSTRAGGLVMCFNNRFAILHSCNADGSDLKCLSVNHASEFDPCVLPDGRILYGRWEYIDKTAFYIQCLWTVNPDGSNETAFFANNMALPISLLQARPVPDSELVVATLSGHNGQPVGAIAMIDPRMGKNSPAAIANFTTEYSTAGGGLYEGPCDPWPLDRDFVLIANNQPSGGTCGAIQLIDRFGSRALIYRDGLFSCYAPRPVAARPRPPMRPSLIQPGQPARFLVNDIYQGMPGVERGRVKKLRIIETTTRVSGRPPGGRWWNQAFLVSWQGSYDLKNVIGVVPVESDGTAYFEAPPGKALYFQALDGDGRMLQSQRTFVQAVEGTTRSCTGCHNKEDNQAPANPRLKLAALQKPAAKIEPESWGAGFLDYAKRVQPVLDRNCVSCHGGQDGIAAGLDLSGGWTWAFNISYETLLKNTLTGFLNCDNTAMRTVEILPPLTHGSGQAPLASLLLSGHKGRLAKMPRQQIDLLLAWMDLNSGYYGTWDYTPSATCNAMLKIGESLTREMENAGCLRCHSKAIGNDWVNLREPAKSRLLRAPMAPGQPLGLGWCRERKAAAPDYPLILNWTAKSPDVFTPKRQPLPDRAGVPAVSFADTNARSYQAMLAIITQARNEALQAPRVDMPGAQIEPGACRDLPPLTPPPVSTKGGQDRF
ncbi:MAG: NPCBM/NEW2 domain-containing protein [Verrucomicrobiae bacterium]